MGASFAWFDYFLFILMLVLSALVGVYYGFIKQQKTATDYLMGGKQMPIWPIAMSLVSSQLSGLTIISLPADTYRYGIYYWFTVVIMILVSLASYYIYLPVFYKLKITSIYEYLNLRFSNGVRMFASILFTLHMVLYLPIIIYVPALALSQVTGLSIHYITPLVCSICIFYTTMGGMKAIVKTDTLQFGIMFGTLSVVVSLGIWLSGGFEPIFRRAYEGGRLNVNFNFDLLKRDTFWSATIGTFFTLTHHFPCSQNFVQKCLSLPSFKSIKLVLIISTTGICLMKTLCIIAGLIIYAKYSDCDPLETKMVKNHDQLLPMYVVDVASFIPGFAGLFISGIFSAALSALSASLNCLAATIYQDFISSTVSKDISEERKSLYLKLIVVITGIIATILVFVVEKLGSLLALSISFAGVTGGTILGLFTVGMMVPAINAKGALYGGIASLAINGWIIFVGLWYKMQGVITYPMLPSSIEGCNTTIIGTLNNILIEPPNNLSSVDMDLQQERPFFFYEISFYWFHIIGASMVLFVSTIISYFTKHDKPLDHDCISPIMHFLLETSENQPPKYNTIDKAKRIVNEN